jgi:PIN domain
MDIILDSNVYISDFRLTSNRFANFFDYVHRTRSSIILPALVRDEVVQIHYEKLSTQLSRVEKELKELRRYTIDEVAFHAPYLAGETKDLKALLRRPSNGVRTKFLASLDGVDLKEVIRRGIKRLPPASESGEELRDVVLWLVVLAHAKSTSRPTAFVTADSGFWESDKPKTQMLRDIDSQQVDVRLYKDLAEFTKANALVSEAVTQSWIETHVTGTNLDEIKADRCMTH